VEVLGYQQTLLQRGLKSHLAGTIRPERNRKSRREVVGQVGVLDNVQIQEVVILELLAQGLRLTLLVR